MDEDDNPYEVLGIDREDATLSNVKSAYRKMALRYHPDKQKTEEDRQRATSQFAKISNAYELLSNPEDKQRYDLQQQRQDRWNAHYHHFHDPFQVFEQVFREEFGRPSPFIFDRDPFFGNRSRGMMGDPFFGSPFGGSLFGGGNMFGGRDPFEEMRRMHQDIEQQNRNMFQHRNRQVCGSQPSSRNVFHSSTNRTRIGGNGESVTTQTTTRMMNGRQQTVTEHIVQKADGTVERHVDTSGDQDFPILEEGHEQRSY
jgi:DnaJ-class molecular chaperone